MIIWFALASCTHIHINWPHPARNKKRGACVKATLSKAFCVTRLGWMWHWVISSKSLTDQSHLRLTEVANDKPGPEGKLSPNKPCKNWKNTYPPGKSLWPFWDGENVTLWKVQWPPTKPVWITEVNSKGLSSCEDPARDSLMPRTTGRSSISKRKKLIFGHAGCLSFANE